jgi:Meiotically Up-regulated Gene 113 (MUG113) protein
MPNRILRDWTDSENIHNLSCEAERFFTRLIMKADDFGRYLGNVRILKGHLFPLHDEITEDHIQNWLSECASNDILKVYIVDGKQYVEIKSFDQKGLKVRRTKYPPSDDGEREDLLMGYVYVIGSTISKPVKIGFSMNPWARLKEISTNHPENLEVLIAFKADRKIESLLHSTMKHLNVKNEWFKLSELEIDLLKYVSNGQITTDELISQLRSNYELLRSTTLPELEVEYEENTKKKQKTNTKENAAEPLVMVWPTFDDFWEAYGKKVDRPKCEKKWIKISQEAREKIMDHVPRYVASTPDVQYRKNPQTYLNSESWNNEILTTNGKRDTKTDNLLSIAEGITRRFNTANAGG